MFKLTIDEAQYATILAALRYYQSKGQGEPDNRSDDIHEIATNGGEVMASLDEAGIDALCDVLQCSPWITGIQTPPYVLVTVSGGVADVAVNESKVDVDILDYDNLKATVYGGEGLILTQRELAYIRANDQPEFVAEVEAALAKAE